MSDTCDEIVQHSVLRYRPDGDPPVQLVSKAERCRRPATDGGKCWQHAKKRDEAGAMNGARRPIRPSKDA